MLKETVQAEDQRGQKYGSIDQGRTAPYERGSGCNVHTEKGAGNSRRNRNGSTGDRRSPLIAAEGVSPRWIARAV
jgi:hypothetical protein